MRVKLHLFELDFGIIPPLCRDHLEEKGAQPAYIGLSVPCFDQIPNQLTAGQHLGVRPLQLLRSRIDAGIDIGPPPADKRDPESLRMLVQSSLQTVDRTPSGRPRPGDRRQNVVLLSTLLLH